MRPRNLELGNKDGLHRNYGNQALILRARGRLEEAFELLKKMEALCLEHPVFPIAAGKKGDSGSLSSLKDNSLPFQFLRSH